MRFIRRCTRCHQRWKCQCLCSSISVCQWHFLCS